MNEISEKLFLLTKALDELKKSGIDDEKIIFFEYTVKKILERGVDSMSILCQIAPDLRELSNAWENSIIIDDAPLLRRLKNASSAIDRLFADCEFEVSASKNGCTKNPSNHSIKVLRPEPNRN